MRAIRVHEHGGPEVLRLETVEDPVPGPGEALVRVEATGVNFIEIYQRKGMYKTPLPSVPGEEGAGTVVAVGPGVTDLRPGDRVVWRLSRSKTLQTNQHKRARVSLRV